MHPILQPVTNFISLPLLELQSISIWADPNTTLSLIKSHLSTLPGVKEDDFALKLGSWNMEYMWEAKAKHFLDTYQEIVKRHHLLAVQEVTKAGLALISQ